ncbi:hypothetical protein GCM10027046_10650 [Uliginosibacterium flavum]|uniref:Uncharacterized protein n=1 Tax=Uliginosibacterium flavum TaxID=1396831 RepID=A0ABV2TNL4_9RHOO
MSKSISFDISSDHGYSADAEIERQEYLDETHVDSFQFGVGRLMEAEFEVKD